MDPISRAAATQILRRSRSGDERAADELMPHLYAELRRLAARYLARERGGHTLQPTALVHEAWLQLFDVRELEIRDGPHFYALAANTMRRVLVQHAREHAALKRGGGARRITLAAGTEPMSEQPELDVLALEEALERLRALDARLVRLVELRFFGGLTVEEAAEVLGVSKRCAEAEWTLARAFLHRELSRE